MVMAANSALESATHYKGGEHGEAGVSGFWAAGCLARIIRCSDGGS